MYSMTYYDRVLGCSEFGSKTVLAKPILAGLPKLFDAKQEPVRDAVKKLMVRPASNKQQSARISVILPWFHNLWASAGCQVARYRTFIALCHAWQGTSIYAADGGETAAEQPGTSTLNDTLPAVLWSVD